MAGNPTRDCIRMEEVYPEDSAVADPARELVRLGMDAHSDLAGTSASSAAGYAA